MARYAINILDIVYQCIDGEHIAIDMKTGAYYSMKHIAAAVWSALLEGYEPEEITQGFCGSYPQQKKIIQESIPAFILKLTSEKLIKPLASESVGNVPQKPFRCDTAETGFHAPILEKFTDMQDYLLVDPIHDIAPEGWPYREDRGNKPTPPAA